MRSAALAAAICAAALAAGCNSDKQPGIAHPRILEGKIEHADTARLSSRQPVQVDFVSARRGFVATGGGVILVTRDGGSHWANRGRVPKLADFDFVSARRGYALTSRNILLGTADAGRSWVRLHRFPRVKWETLATLAFIDPEHGWVMRASALYRTRDAGRTWIGLPVPCGEYDQPVGPSFVDARTGYLVCGGQPGAGSQGKQLYSTKDGGASWQLRSSIGIGEVGRGTRTMPSGGYVSRLNFLTGETGFMTAQRAGIYETSTGGLTWRNLFYAESMGDVSFPSRRRLFVVLRAGLLGSDDAGSHWRRVYPPGFAEPQDSSIIFFSAKNAIAFGAPEPLGEPRTVLATRNGGRTWSMRGKVTALRGLVEQVFRFGDVVLVTDGARLARSDDRGRNWRKVSTPSVRERGWFSFISPRVGFLADERGRLSQTEDGGSTWRVVAEKTRDLQGVVFVSEDEALLIDYGPPPPEDGRKHLGPPPRLLHSGDGGKSWNELPSGVQNITAVTVLDAKHWWIFANAGCSLRRPCTSGRILRTADGGEHWDLVRLAHALDVLTGNFVSAKVGFAGSPWSGFYRTDDGGVTWRAVYPR